VRRLIRRETGHEDPAAPLLAFVGVSKTYRRGRRHKLRLLAEASFEVRAGEIVSVWAGRGRGKTTLLEIAKGETTPDQGAVCFAGQDLRRLSDARRTRLAGTQIGWVESGGPRTGMRPLDFVALPLLIGPRDRTVYARAMDALSRVGALHCAESPWSLLTRAERALIGVAYAIVRRPKLVLVDDANLAFGREGIVEAVGLLRSLSSELGFGVLMTVSEVSAVRCSDRGMTLVDGRLREMPVVDPTGGLENVVAFWRDDRRLSS